MESTTDRPGPPGGGTGPQDRSVTLSALIRERFGTATGLAREAHTRPRRWPEDTPAAVRARRRRLIEWE